MGPEEQCDPKSLTELLEQRDKSDRERKIGPLVQVPEAVLVDNSKLGLEETVDTMLAVIHKEN